LSEFLQMAMDGSFSLESALERFLTRCPKLATIDKLQRFVEAVLHSTCFSFFFCLHEIWCFFMCSLGANGIIKQKDIMVFCFVLFFWGLAGAYCDGRRSGEVVGRAVSEP